MIVFQVEKKTNSRLIPLEQTPHETNARELAAKILVDAERRKAFVDLLLSARLGSTRLSSKDRAFVSELVRGTVRWRRYLEWIAKKRYRGDFRRVPPFVRAHLLLALYQLLFLGVPAYAAVHEAVEIVKQRYGEDWAGKVNATLRAVERCELEELQPRSPNPVRRLAIRWSHPDWMVERWLRAFGEQETKALLAANNQAPPLTVRVNSGRAAIEEVIQKLREEGIASQTIPGFDNFLRLDGLNRSLDKVSAFQFGWIVPQDPSASLAVELLAPQPGETVFDLCAAPGGKTTEIAERVGPMGRVYSSDRHAGRMRLVREATRRLGLANVSLVVADATTPAFARLTKVLLDVPCSGTGVIRRRVDLKWRRRPEQISELVSIQLGILNAAAELQSKGDVLVYSTCTLEPEENEDVVNAFLDRNPNYEVEPAQAFVSEDFCTREGFVRTFPHRHGVDGVFVARLVKKR